ncbi:hypothetical protein [Acinetobacter indicus]|uniref:hypothetical protein n=1 Tax=Acinetobacter indicus TaxID=756892 RepID=UPI00209B872A|nr:hypothetical protein [Acinetobacter indicus]MCO8088251.1 hypothetical protein [Acinetobacter indicus]
MSKKAILKYVTTNGLMVTGEGLNKPTLCKVWFKVFVDDTVEVTVENTYTGNTIRRLGKKIISREELRNMPEDPYNSMVFNKAAFDLFGLSF